MAKEPQPDESGDPNSSVEEDDVNSHQEDQDDSDQEVEKVEVKPKKKKKVYKLTLEETENFNEKLRKRGVIYIARVPPRMTPTKIKALLSDFDEVTRVYLVEEDQTIRKRRKKEHGSSGGKRYNEGWVELASKRKAKHIAASLNNTPISNIKRNPHCGMKSEHP
jgi:ESF2/ABP1 family protein